MLSSFRVAIGGSLNRFLTLDIEYIKYIKIYCFQCFSNVTLTSFRSVLFIEWLCAYATFQDPSTEVGSRKGPRNLPRSTQANASVLGEVSPSL